MDIYHMWLNHRLLRLLGKHHAAMQVLLPGCQVANMHISRYLSRAPCLE